MSILIRGMEMPENCFDCRYICGLRDSQKFTKNRRPDCPLVPVPPHGRLIDQKQLSKMLNDDKDYLAMKAPDDGFNYMEQAFGVNRAIHISEVCPTIIPASGGQENE